MSLQNTKQFVLSLTNLKLRYLIYLTGHSRNLVLVKPTYLEVQLLLWIMLCREKILHVLWNPNIIIWHVGLKNLLTSYMSLSVRSETAYH